MTSAPTARLCPSKSSVPWARAKASNIWKSPPMSVEPYFPFPALLAKSAQKVAKSSQVQESGREPPASFTRPGLVKQAWVIEDWPIP
jgi:hypothetical protein